VRLITDAMKPEASLASALALPPSPSATSAQRPPFPELSAVAQRADATGKLPSKPGVFFFNLSSS
jgi:hypothetical protein